MIAAILTLIVLAPKALRIIKNVDWLTLLFFAGLFICVGGLEKTGVLTLLANFIGTISKGNLTIVISVILWVSACASAIVDNIPFAATMCPVLAGLSQSTGLSLPAMSWSLALGTDIGGNGTPIGASANVVGTAIAEKEGYPITWGRYCKYALPAMIMVVGLCHLLLIMIYT
jgi:Na+/H+ antiporter NhaD/arsenite permease-like protein